MPNKTLDVIVIGGGHNGLVAASYLAKAGKRVVVLERAERVGGILRATEPAPGFTAPGLVHTVGRLRASVVKDLKLDRFGYRTVTPSVRMHAPIPDGSAVTFWADADAHGPGTPRPEPRGRRRRSSPSTRRSGRSRASSRTCRWRRRPTRSRRRWPTRSWA